MSLSKEQLAMRRSGLSASDPAAIAGLHPSRTAIDVYREKTEEGFVQEQSEAMEIGDLLEAPVAELYRRRTGAILETSGTLRHPGRKLMLATPDRIAIINGERRLLEVKTSAAFGARDLWGPEGSAAIPEHHFCQVQWTMFVAQVKSADVAALFSGREFAVFHVELDMDYVNAMYELGMDFHKEHVAKRIPPSPDGSPSWTEFIKRRLPASTSPQFLEATSEDISLIQEYRAGQELEKQAEAMKAMPRQLLELRIGEHSGLEGHGLRLSWKSVKPRQTTNWAGLAMKLGATDAQIKEYTSESASYRQFVVREIKPKAHRLSAGSEEAA